MSNQKVQVRQRRQTSKSGLAFFLLTLPTEEAVGEAELSSAVLGVPAAVVGERVVDARRLRLRRSVVDELATVMPGGGRPERRRRTVENVGEQVHESTEQLRARQRQ